MSPQKIRERLEALEKENAELRKLLGLDAAHEETWAVHAPQHLRDQMAASALIAEKLDEPRALIRLGFKVTGDDWHLLPEVRGTCKRIFDTPGVKAILARDLEDAEKNKAQIIARLVQTSVHGTDGDSVRSAQQLAKMAGWNSEERGAVAGNVTNIMQIFGEKRPEALGAAQSTADADGIIDADFFMEHEPGAATVVLEEDTQALTR